MKIIPALPIKAVAAKAAPVTHKLAIVTEHSCATAYALHEVFHLSSLVLWTAYGLLIFGTAALVTLIISKGV